MIALYDEMVGLPERLQTVGFGVCFLRPNTALVLYPTQCVVLSYQPPGPIAGHPPQLIYLYASPSGELEQLLPRC